MAYNGSQAQAGRGSSLSIGATALAAPGSITGTGSGSGGTLAAGSYYYKVTAIDALGGESAASVESSVVTTTGSTSSVALTAGAVSGAVGYRFYRGTAMGAENTYYSSATITFTDTGAAGTSGTPPATSAGTLIGEVTDSPLNRGEWMFDDTTNFQSGSDKEVISTIRDTGSVPFKVNRVGSDAGQLLVEAAYQSGAKQSFAIMLPKTAAQATKGDSYSFAAYVKSSKLTVETTKKVGLEIDLMTTGPITFSAGS
jgi:hypothetical protein